MTTPGFGTCSSAVAHATAEVRKLNCQPPHYRLPMDGLNKMTEPAPSLASAYHPDPGGDLVKMCDLNSAREEALRALEK